LLADLGESSVVLCGAGLGAVAALDLLLRRPELTQGAVLIEPPLLAFVDEATDLLSEDGEALRAAVHAGGPAAGVELYLSGRLVALGPGAERLPAEVTMTARDRPLSLFAELAAVPSWPLPLGTMARNQVPVRIVVGESGPALLRRAGGELTAHLSEAELRQLGGTPPHLAEPQAVADLVGEVL